MNNNEAIKVLLDTEKIIYEQTKHVSPYWQVSENVSLKLTIGDINRLLFAIEALTQEKED